MSVTADISRRQLTDLVISTIHAATIRPVGDAIAPAAGGWQGQPNNAGSNFVPYNVVLPGLANRSSGPFDAPQADWQLPYLIWGFGVVRNQCEAIADLARDALEVLRAQIVDLGGTNYKIQQVRTESIGAVNRYDQTDPAYYGQQDSVTIWITKEP